jgi:hypothetical protein
MFLILFVLTLEGGAHGKSSEWNFGRLNAACCSLTVELALVLPTRLVGRDNPICQKYGNPDGYLRCIVSVFCEGVRFPTGSPSPLCVEAPHARARLCCPQELGLQSGGLVHCRLASLPRWVDELSTEASFAQNAQFMQADDDESGALWERFRSCWTPDASQVLFSMRRCCASLARSQRSRILTPDVRGTQ